MLKILKMFNVGIRPIDEFFTSFDQKQELGKGRFGEVKLCSHKTTKKLYAAKSFSQYNVQEKQNAEKEFDILKSLQHPNVVECFGAFESNNEFVLVLEFVGGGELFDKVVDDDFVLTEKDCQNYIRQICLALEYIHKQGVIHLDLKPENVMCVNGSAHKIKLIDFGLAQRYNPGKKIKVLFGTPEFMAPEVVNYEEIDLNTDMWSLGVIAYVLLSGLSPFMGETTGETLSSITKADFDFDDEEFDDVSKEAKDFITKLLVKEKGKRMTSTQALKHPWLNPTPEKRKLRRINTKRHQKYLIHHRWQQAIGAIKTINLLNLKEKLGSNIVDYVITPERRNSTSLKNSRSDPSLLNSIKTPITPKKYVPPTPAPKLPTKDRVGNKVVNSVVKRSVPPGPSPKQSTQPSSIPNTVLQIPKATSSQPNITKVSSTQSIQSNKPRGEDKNNTNQTDPTTKDHIRKTSAPAFKINNANIGPKPGPVHIKCNLFNNLMQGTKAKANSIFHKENTSNEVPKPKSILEIARKSLVSSNREKFNKR